MSSPWRKKLFYVFLPLLIVFTVFSAHFTTDISAFFIAGDNAEEILLAGEMQSGKLSRRYILSIGSPGQNPVSIDFINSLIAHYQQIDAVNDVWRPGQKRLAVKAIQSLYLHHAAQLYSLDPESELQKLLSKSGLNHKAALLKKTLTSAHRGKLKKIALQDPLFLSLNGFKNFAGQIFTVYPKDSLNRNLILETKMAGLDYARQKEIQKQLRDIFTDLSKAYNKNYSLQMTGVPVFAVATQNLIEGDVKKVSLLSSVALTLLFLCLFRSIGALFQVILLLVSAITVSVMLTNLIFGSVHVMTMAIGTTLIGICIDYPIHALVHARNAPVKQRISVINKIWPSMLMGGVTTLVGYTALGLSGYPGFQQIAVYAGTGILVSLLLTRYLLPELMSNRDHGALNIPLVNNWVGFCRRFRSALIFVLVLLLGGSLSGMKSLHWVEDLEQLTPELNHLQANDKAIRAKMISSIEPGRFILVSGKTLEHALRKAERLYPLLEQLKEKGELADYFGLYPWLLSEHRQQQNYNILQKKLSAEVKEQWRDALRAQGLSVELLGGLHYPRMQSLSLKELLASPVGRFIDNQIIVNRQQTLILIWIAHHQPDKLQSAIEKLDGVRYFSQRDQLNRMAADYRDRAQKMLIVGLTIIVLMLLLRYKNLLITLQTLLPALLAAFFILAGWSLSGATISFLHLVGFLLAVAICVDYGIFYRENRSGNSALTYQAMAASMITSALAFGSLAIADTSSLQTLAAIVSLGVILGFLFCPIIIRPAIVEDSFYLR